MDVSEIRDYCLKKKGVTESFPFDVETLVFKVGDKMFLLVPLEKQPATFSAKSDPDYSVELREKYPQITGAYHMNKLHWNTITCDGLKRDLIFRLIDNSYDLVFSGLTKRIREEILEGE